MADLAPKLQGRARIGDSTPYNILSYAGRERAKHATEHTTGYQTSARNHCALLTDHPVSIIAPNRPMTAYPSSRVQAERTIAAARVLLAASSLFAIWLDPAEPERFVQLTYALQIAYVVYSIGVAVFVLTQSSRQRLPTSTLGLRQRSTGRTPSGDLC